MNELIKAILIVAIFTAGQIFFYVARNYRRKQKKAQQAKTAQDEAIKRQKENCRTTLHLLLGQLMNNELLWLEIYPPGNLQRRLSIQKVDDPINPGFLISGVELNNQPDTSTIETDQTGAAAQTETIRLPLQAATCADYVFAHFKEENKVATPFIFKCSG